MEQKIVNPKIRDWEVKVKVWQRQAIGDKKSAIRRYFELHAGKDGYPELTPDRATIAKICDELRTLSPELVLKLPSEVQAYAKKLNPHLKESLGLQPRNSRKTLTVEEIVIGEERKQAILKHRDALRDVASQWKSQIWLPPPWRWDMANLRYVFYVDTKNQGAGNKYKLPEELVRGEESRGHVRAFIESQRSVTWDVLEDESIVVKAPVEDEPLFDHLKVHTEGAPAWRLFTEWNKKGGTYLRLCSSLLARIEQDTKSSMGAKSELSWWSIYHDAFCTEDTLLCCERCGTENPYAFTCPICGGKFSQEEEITRHIGNNHPKADPKAWRLPSCQNCFMSLGWLRPRVKGYERVINNPQSVAIAIDRGTIIEESVEIERYESYIRGHAGLRDKYLGCDLVKTILQREKEVRQVQERLIGELTSLSEQKVFYGKYPACPDY